MKLVEQKKHLSENGLKELFQLKQRMH